MKMDGFSASIKNTHFLELWGRRAQTSSLPFPTRPSPARPRAPPGSPPDPSFSSLPFPCNTRAHAQHYQGHQFRAVQPVLGEVLLLKLIADFYEVSYVFFSLPTRAAQQLRRETGAPIPGAAPGPKGELHGEPQTPQRQRSDPVPVLGAGCR